MYLSGLSESWIAIGLIVGAYLNWLFVAGRLRVQTEHNGNALTLPDYFTNRFEDNSRLLRIFSALVILVFFTIYCASGIVAGARLFESTFGLSYETALWAGAAATIAYTFIGGFLAVSWTDTVQASLMIFALILTPVIVMLATGGVEPTFTAIELKDATSFDMLKGASFIGVISLMAWGLLLRPAAHPGALHGRRFGEIDPGRAPHLHDLDDPLPRRRRGRGLLRHRLLPGASGAGRRGQRQPRAGVHRAGQDPVQPVGRRRAAVRHPRRGHEHPELPTAGLLLGAHRGLLQAFLRKGASQLELVWVGRAMVLLVAVIAIWLAANPENRVLGLVSYAWAGFGAAFGPLVLFSLLWKRMTRNGALAGMIVGAATVILWKNLLGWTGLYEIIPGFLFASVAIVVFSLLGKAPSTSMLKRFDDAEQEYREAHQGSAAPVTQR